MTIVLLRVQCSAVQCSAKDVHMCECECVYAVQRPPMPCVAQAEFSILFRWHQLRPIVQHDCRDLHFLATFSTMYIPLHKNKTLSVIFRFFRCHRTAVYRALLFAVAAIVIVVVLLFCCAPYFVATVKTHFLSRRQRVTMRNNILVVTCESCCK